MVTFHNKRGFNHEGFSCHCPNYGKNVQYNGPDISDTWITINNTLKQSN